MKPTGPIDGVTRRGFLSGSGALIAGTVLAGEGLSTKRAAAEPPAAGAPPPRLIDVHHHFFTPYAKALQDKMHSTQPGGALETWTPEVSLRKMEQVGLSAAVLSMSTWHGDPLNSRQRRDLCR